jgi:gamma-butyrobetaine dioxygenase
MRVQSEQIVIGPLGAHLPQGPLEAASAHESGVLARFADREVHLNAEWLRDNCPCELCCIVQTDERRFQPWQDPAPATIAHLSVANGDLHIVWSNGHESVYTPTVFARVDRAIHRGTYTANLWGSGYELSHFDHDAAAGDSLTRVRLFEAFMRDGAVVVTGAPVIPGTVIDFVQALGLTLHDSSLGLIFDVTADPAGYNVAFTAEHIPPHNDNAQYTDPPSGQVLAMLVNDAVGGESIVVDGWAVLEQLNNIDPGAVDILTRVAVGFRQYSATAEAFTRAPLVVRDATGRFSHLRFSNQLRQPLPFDHPDLADWYRAYRLLGSIVTSPANHISFRLNAGDMLFVNGFRVLHSRAEFQADKPRHLQDVFFDVDDIVGNLARLTGEAPIAMIHP